MVLFEQGWGKFGKNFLKHEGPTLSINQARFHTKKCIFATFFNFQLQFRCVL